MLSGACNALVLLAAVFFAAAPGFVGAFTTTNLAFGTVNRRVIAPGTGDKATMASALTAGQPNTYVEIIPCFGDFTFYARANTLPTATSSTVACTDPCLKADTTQVGFQQRFSLDATVHILIQGLGASTGSLGNGATAIADVLIIDADNTSALASLIPSPPSTDVTVEIFEGNTEATLEWQLTQDPRDTYRVFKYTGEIPEGSGYRSSTACGVELFMADVTQTYKLTMGGATAKMEMTNLDPDTRYTYKVVVSRQGGYKNEYGTRIVNSSQQLVFSITMLVAAMALVL